MYMSVLGKVPSPLPANENRYGSSKYLDWVHAMAPAGIPASPYIQVLTKCSVATTWYVG